MIRFSIVQANVNDKPSINFEGEFSILNELNSCDVEYILNEVIPSLEKIMHGELILYPDTADGQMLDSYEFGYTAVMVDFYRDKSIIDNTWDADFIKLEVPSKEIFNLMKDWGKHLLEWKNNNPD